LSADILTEEEIEALLEAVRDGAVPAAAGGSKPDSRRVQPYDFLRPSRLSMEQTRTLQRLHEKVSEVMSASLSNYLGVSVDVSLTSVQEFSYELMMDSLPSQLYVTVLSLAPQRESGMLTMDLPLCLGLVDRLLGGDGKATNKRRPLSTIDQAICDNVVEAALRTLRESWQEFQQMELRPIERKTDCRLLQLMSPSETLLCVCFQVGGQIEAGEIRFAVPLQSLESCLGKLTRNAAISRKKPGQSDTSRERARSVMVRVPLKLEAQLGSTEITISRMLRLGVGDTLRLEQKTSEPITLLVDGAPKFLVKPGVSGRNKAVQVVRTVSGIN